MQKTLFSKHFITIAAIILLSITILGAVLLAFASQYFKQDRYRLLEHNAQQAAELTYADFRSNLYQGVTPAVVLPRDIYLANTDGKLLLFVSGSHSDYNEVDIPKNIISEACAAGEYQEVGKVGGLYSQNHYTVGIPVKTESGVPAAVIFASASAGTLTVFLKEILKMFIISSLAVLILAFAAVYFITADLVRPLRKMVAATQSFSKGDFTVRVPVESYDEIGQLAISFNNMATSLATTEVARRSFTANVSHELKTPLTSISGYAEIIREGMVKSEDVGRFAGKIYEEAQRLITLVEDILNLSHLDEGAPGQERRQGIDLYALCERAVASLAEAARQRGIAISLTGSRQRVDGAEKLLAEIIFNLCDNAIKYNQENGHVAVSVTREGDRVVLTVQDTGIGIPPGETDRVFERFYRVDKSHSKEIGGTGLGLSIVKHAAAYHDAKIQLDSQLGRGTRVRVLFPLSQREAQP